MLTVETFCDQVVGAAIFNNYTTHYTLLVSRQRERQEGSHVQRRVQSSNWSSSARGFTPSSTTYRRRSGTHNLRARTRNQDLLARQERRNAQDNHQQEFAASFQSLFPRPERQENLVSQHDEFDNLSSNTQGRFNAQDNHYEDFAATIQRFFPGQERGGVFASQYNIDEVCLSSFFQDNDASDSQSETVELDTLSAMYPRGRSNVFDSELAALEESLLSSRQELRDRRDALNRQFEDLRRIAGLSSP